MSNDLLIHKALLLSVASLVAVSPGWAQNTDDSSVLQVEHVNTVEPESESEPESEPEAEQISEPETSTEDDQLQEDVSAPGSEAEAREGESVESTRVSETPPAPIAPLVPEVSKARSDEEAISLRRLVRELQYGSLENSIKLLETMVKAYPYDPDYRALLAAARNLNNADIWYRYQR
ncbi:MAG TPA: hypothetical protein PKC98_07425, partial [Candidatus Melainabacteria bacterium]|nr:hypothetical protein [Candidatus Melainabacteria bacterium]